jgi:hypothetical protein
MTVYLLNKTYIWFFHYVWEPETDGMYKNKTKIVGTKDQHTIGTRWLSNKPQIECMHSW